MKERRDDHKTVIQTQEIILWPQDKPTKKNNKILQDILWINAQCIHQQSSRRSHLNQDWYRLRPSDWTGKQWAESKGEIKVGFGEGVLNLNKKRIATSRAKTLNNYFDAKGWAEQNKNQNKTNPTKRQCLAVSKCRLEMRKIQTIRSMVPFTNFLIALNTKFSKLIRGEVLGDKTWWH